MLGWQDAISALDTGPLPLGLAPEENPIFMLLGWLLGLEPGELWEIFQAYPPILTIIFAITIFATPFLVLILAMDQTGSDISRKHTRYLTVRTNRRALYIGKTLAVCIYWAVSLALAIGILGAICVLGDLLGSAPTSESLMFLVRLYLSAFAFGLPFIMLAGAAAALTGHPALGGLVTFGLWVVVALMSWALGIQNDAFTNLEYLFPTAMKFQLISTDTGSVGLALAHQLGYAAVMFFLGIAIFARRDL
jgi:ABC-type transport system involved in multi-copper enzyme maturation permease subunit